MSAAATPSREAVSRSMTTLASRPLSCWSVFTCWSCGRARIFCSNWGAHVLSSIQVLALQRVLILRLAQTAADLQILLRLHVERGAGNFGKFLAQFAQ